MGRSYSSQGIREAVADLLDRQKAYLEAHGKLLRMSLDACDTYGMDEGANGFRLIQQSGWADQIQSCDSVLCNGAEILADTLQSAERTEMLLTGKMLGGMQ